MATEKKPPRESTESRRLIQSAFELARSLEIEKLLVRADLVSDVDVINKSRVTESVVWLSDVELDTPERSDDHVVLVPDRSLSRISQVKLGLFVAVVRGYVAFEESVVCLSGVAGSNRIDTLLITNPKRDFPWLTERDSRKKSARAMSDILESVIQIALQIAVGGHEGRPVGAVFVIGDEKKLEPHLRQLILNPCAGHPAATRNVHNPQFTETIREFAALDGAFVVNRKGTVVSAGTYLDAPLRGVRLRGGFGARHTSAAAITHETGAIAVVVSETSGAVRVFREGRIALELEKPEPRARRKGKSTASKSS